VRATDLDVFGHVNNASHWPILEEVLAGPSFDRVGRAEIEYLAPIDRSTPVELLVAPLDAGVGAWLTADGRVHTAARWIASADRPSGTSVR
jgi:acyl-ACP thioesterase